MGLLKSFKQMFKCIKEGGIGKGEDANEPQEAATEGGSMASNQEPMQSGLQTIPVATASSSTLAACKLCCQDVQSLNSPYVGSFEPSRKLLAASFNEDAKPLPFVKDNPCSPATPPAANSPSFSTIHTHGAARATPFPCSKTCTPAAHPTQIKNESSNTTAKTGRTLSFTAVPEEKALVYRAKAAAPITRTVSLKALRQIQSYSFISDVDCSEAQQAVDSSDSEDEKQHQQHIEGDIMWTLSSSSEYASSTAHSQKLANGYQHRSAASRTRGFSALSSAKEVPECRSSHVSRGGNAKPPVSDISNGYNDNTCSNISMLSSHPNMIEELLSSEPKLPKDSNVLAVSAALPLAMKRSVWSVDDFEVIKQLHNGHASKVYSAECKSSGLMVVRKVYRLEEMCDFQRCQLLREISIHSKLQHQNIVQLHCAFMVENCVIIVLQFAAGGDMFRYMRQMGGRLAESAVVKLVLQPLLRALVDLHTKGIIHRDVKLENLLLDSDMVLQLADFGLAINLREERANTKVGTLDYMAPEVLRCPTKETPDQSKVTAGASQYSMAVDCWSVGVLAYELLCGRAPFTGNKMMETAHNIIRGDVHSREGLSPGAVDFISSCLEPNPADRLTVIKMLNHPWIKMFARSNTINNLQGGRSSASQQDSIHSGRSSRPAINVPSMGRLALIIGRQTQPTATKPVSAHELQRGQAIKSHVASPTNGGHN